MNKRALLLSMALGISAMLAGPAPAWSDVDLTFRFNDTEEKEMRAALDQFEQQIRALCGLPLGSPALLSPVAMINLLGDLWSGGTPRWDRALALPGVKLHLYGKADARPGRKMGHLNCLAPTPREALALARRAHAALLAQPSP